VQLGDQIAHHVDHEMLGAIPDAMSSSHVVTMNRPPAPYQGPKAPARPGDRVVTAQQFVGPHWSRRTDADRHPTATGRMLD
jgi:hypothetical protein